MKCSNCGAELAENAVFCGSCGTKVEVAPVVEPDDEKTIIYRPEETEESDDEKTVLFDAEESEEDVEEPAVEEPVAEEPVEEVAPVEETPVVEAAPTSKTCPQCGAANELDADFCSNCGTSLNAQAQSTPVTPVAPVVTPTPTPVQPKKEFDKKPLIIVAIVLAALLVLGGLGFFFLKSGISFGKKSENKKPMFVYFKDNTIMMPGKKDNIELSDDVWKDKTEEDYLAPYYVDFTEDYKYMYYPQDINEEGVYDLYVKKVNDKKDEGTKVLSKITSYDIVKYDELIYEKDNEKLYYYKKGSEEKLESHCDTHYLSDDKKYVLWVNDDAKLYAKKIGDKNDAVKLASDVTSIQGFTEDLSSIVVKKDSDLYLIKDLEDSTKLSSHVNGMVTSTLNCDKNDGFYYEVCDEDDYAAVEHSSDNYYENAPDVSEIVDDSFYESDHKMKEPDVDDYQKIEIRRGYYRSYEYTVTDWDAYEAAYDKYYEKMVRDTIRYYINDSISFSKPDSELHYYNLKTGEDTVIAKDYYNASSMYDSENECHYVLSGVVNKDSFEKISMKKLVDIYNNESSYDMVDRIKESIEDSMVYTLYSATNAIELDMSFLGGEEVVESVEAFEGNVYVVTLDADAKESGIYCTSIKKADGVFTAIAEDLDGKAYLWHAEDGDVYYAVMEYNTKDSYFDYDSCDVYVNDKKIDSDATAYTFRYSDGSLFYIKGLDDDEESGTLAVYKGKDSEKVQSDVYAWSLRTSEDGRIAMLVDYDIDDEEGDLYMYNGKESKKIDSDVNNIILFQ